jgi:diacylglycerol kinase (ATP)
MPADNQAPNPFFRLYKASGYSLAGLRSAFTYEQAFRLEVYLSFILIPLAIWLAQTPIELILLVGSWVMVMIIELINSAVEATVDRIGSEIHALSGRAKDMGSAAVMISVLLFLFTWLTLLLY